MYFFSFCDEAEILGSCSVPSQAFPHYNYKSGGEEGQLPENYSSFTFPHRRIAKRISAFTLLLSFGGDKKLMSSKRSFHFSSEVELSRLWAIGYVKEWVSASPTVAC